MALFGCAPKRPLDYSGSAGLLWAITGGRLGLDLRSRPLRDDGDQAPGAAEIVYLTTPALACTR